MSRSVAHQGDLGYGTVAWKDVPKEDGRPVAFSAYGSVRARYHSSHIAVPLTNLPSS